MATVGNTGIHRSGSISDYLNNSYDSPDCMGLHWEYRLTNDFVLDDIMDLPSGAVDMYKLPTIQGDVERISNRSRSISFSWCDISDDIDSKTEIRNGDCMWSSFGAGTCSSNTNSNSSNHNSNSSNSNGGSNSAASSYSESSAVPPAIVTGGALLIKREPEEEHEDTHETEDDEDNRTTAAAAAATTATGTLTVAEHISKLRSKIGTTATIAIPRPKASNGNILRYPSVKLSSNSNTAEQHIPPGASLLRKSNTKFQQMRYLSNLSSSATLPLKTNNINNNNDEHLPEFRHNVDLAACVMGSNNISLTQDNNSSNSCKSNNDANNIDHLSRELQNKSKEFRIDKLPYRVPAVTPENIADVLDVISQQCDAAVSAVATLSPPASSADGDSDDGECSVVDSSCGSATSLDGNCMQHISDHSYTRCNEMETTLETPSDSDEEIDVVSLNDKKLPNNPSDRDRRFFSKVINKNLAVPSNGRSNYSLPYTPASSSPVKSEANSRYPSPSPSPFPPSYQNSIWLTTRSESSSAGSDCTTQPTAGQANSRKRLYKNKDAGYRVYPVKGFAAKKRVKKSVNETTTTTTGNVLQQQHQPTLGASGISSSGSTTSSSSVSGGSSSSSNSNSNSMLKRQFSLDEADTIEKRNQHNDMERQRRIGLKNLFEALKKQIPTIRDKERAPKVNILREAAKLCEQLSSEERELSLKRQQLKAKLKQQQDLLARLRSAKNLGE